MSDSPDKVLPANDPGDDTQRRFRYQATRAALLALSLFDEDSEIEELFCELQEDVLLKKRDNTFIGEQIKTSLDGIVPLKAGDEAVVGSIQRFIHHDRRHAGCFCRHVISSSTGFWHEEKNGSNLPYLLDLIAKANGQRPRPIATYLKRLVPPPPKKSAKKKSAANGDATSCEGGNEADNHTQPELSHADQLEFAHSVLIKVRLETLPGLRDIEAVLIKQLPRLGVIGDRLHSELTRIATAIVGVMLEAASLVHETPRDRYLAIFNDPKAIHAETVIDGKRITRDRLLTIIQKTLSEQPTLCTNNHYSVDDLPRGMNTLEAKMAASGLSIDNVELAKDLKASTELLLAQWLQKDGTKAATERYQHLRTLVRNECQEAHDKSQTAGSPYGTSMLEEVRTRLRQRLKTDGQAIFGCNYEHLLGMVGILTEDCTLWWSDKFELPKGRNP